MRKRAKVSPNWVSLRDVFENSDISARELGRRAKVSEKTIRNKIKAEGWARKAARLPQEVRTDDLTDRAETVANETLFPSATDLAKRFCGTVEVLQAELDTVVRNLRLLQEISEADIDRDDEKAATARRRLINKVLELPGLVKAANDLTAALARLADNGPGKKEEAIDRAKAAGTGRFATPEAPKAGATTH
jgi:hypothetical protein